MFMVIPLILYIYVYVFYERNEWAKYIQENNVVVEVLYKFNRKLLNSLIELHVCQCNARHVMRSSALIVTRFLSRFSYHQ